MLSFSLRNLVSIYTPEHPNLTLYIVCFLCSSVQHSLLMLKICNKWMQWKCFKYTNYFLKAHKCIRLLSFNLGNSTCIVNITCTFRLHGLFKYQKADPFLNQSSLVFAFLPICYYFPRIRAGLDNCTIHTPVRLARANCIHIFLCHNYFIEYSFSKAIFRRTSKPIIFFLYMLETCAIHSWSN